MCSQYDDPTQHDLPKREPWRDLMSCPDDCEASYPAHVEDGGHNAGRDPFGRDDLGPSAFTE